MIDQANLDAAHAAAQASQQPAVGPFNLPFELEVLMRFDRLDARLTELLDSLHRIEADIADLVDPFGVDNG